MAEEGFKRKLAAILSADVIGYSRLMRDDEEATVRDIAAHRVLISDIVQKHHGRVVDSPGDNILAEFASVVDAVNGAINIQEEISKSNADTPEDRRMEFRIGINLGDVIEEEERIYGDGVNIAARVEGLASAGGIAISGTVYEHIKDKLSLGYHFLGEKDVKNIPEPVRVYRLLTEPDDAGKMTGVEIKTPKKGRIWIALAAVFVAVIGIGIWQFYTRRPTVEPASVEKMAYPLPDKPSIAVLPFDNMSGDPEQEFLSDGISENIITSLSKTDELFVIARNSTFTYKGKPVNVKQVAEDLGVRYVLEGSVQKSEDRVRITAQLIDAISGHHLWAERYDRDLKDIFALQDEITKKIIVSLGVTLQEGEQLRVWAEKTKNLDYFLKFTKAIYHLNKFALENTRVAGRIGHELIEMEPQNPSGYDILGWYYLFLNLFGVSPKENLAKAYQMAKKSLSLDESNPMAHLVMSDVSMTMRLYDKAIDEAEQAIVLSPNFAYAYQSLGSKLSVAGRPDEAIEKTHQAMRLDPFPSIFQYINLGRSYLLKHQYEQALVEYSKAYQQSPDSPMVLRDLAVTYGLLGREDEAREKANKLLEIIPDYSLESIRRLPFKNQSDIELIVQGSRKAGIPETPPLPLPDKPSIAVLAFDNLSGDPGQEYFSDGIAEDIITALSKTPKIFVIARNSSFTYKGKPVKVQQVGRDLGVRYVLEGSVRKVGEKVRITAQLIDARTGHHLWAEKYDRELGDIFAVQDEITKKVILELHIKLTHGEQARIYSKGTDNIDAYLMAMQAQWYSYLWNKNRNLEARRLVEKAIVLAPDYAYAHRILGMTHVVDIFVGLSQSPKKSLTLAMNAYKKAISLDKSLASAYLGMGFVLTMLRKHDEAVSIGKKAILLEPNSADVLQGYGSILTYSGMVEEAIPLFREVRRLNPIPSNSYYHSFGHALRLSGKYDEAIALQRKAIKQEPDDHLSYIILGYSASLAGRDEEAQAAVKELLRIKPNFSVANLIAPFKDRAILVQNCEALNKAGLSLKCDALRTASK